MLIRNPILKIIYNSHSFENCACIIFHAMTRVSLPFCHKSMIVICEVEPQRCVMCITNKKDKLDYIVYRYMYQNIFCIYKMIRLWDDDKRSYICTVHMYHNCTRISLIFVFLKWCISNKKNDYITGLGFVMHNTARNYRPKLSILVQE